jgi:nitroimidazol reductase NimA-like FMN-containing flavoprotein (pyridoxamine 5'-phosphate oxidase superfamily)
VTGERDLAAEARAIVDASLYMVLATADREGRPWASPVYFAPRGYREFFWVSKPGARHSLNIEERPEVGIVIFDSSVPIATGKGVYLSATAEQLTGTERDEPLAVFSRRTLSHGGREWTTADVEAPGAVRLYRAVASEQFILDENDFRLPMVM